MTCYQHPNMNSVARCAQCGKEICAACLANVDGKIVCRDCAELLRSQPDIASREAPAESQAHDPMPDAADLPAGAPNRADDERSGVPAPIPPSAVAQVARPAPLAVPSSDLGTGGKRAKESLLSAALSLVLPGAGQAYNGQVAKGLILAAIYLGSIAAIIGGIVVAALAAGRFNGAWATCCCCLPLLILPIIVLIYAIYDAYNTAEKINDERDAGKQP